MGIDIRDDRWKNETARDRRKLFNCPSTTTSSMSCFQQFFESINPKSDFNNDGDALETYLYEKSLKVQPKDTEKAADVKPKRSLHVLKSPGIKPPKSNHYSTNHHHSASSHGTQTSTVPSTPSHDSDGPKSALLTPPSGDDAHFALVDINPGQQPKFIGDVPRRATAPTHKIGQLQPPPLYPRKTHQSYQQKVPTASSSQVPPPLHPRRPGQTTASSPSSSKSPSTPARTPGEHSPSAFVFPSVDSISFPPVIPPRKPTDSLPQPLNNEQLRVVLDRPSSSESQSPTVCLSVPLPPALPPRRGTSGQQAPPPLPPKTRVSGSPSLQRVVQSSISVDPPPPLPPKTYKARKQSTSPTNIQ